jgi:dolichol kinase
MGESGAARVGVTAAEKQSEAVSSAPPMMAPPEVEGTAPELGAAPFVDVETMVVRLQQEEASPARRRARLMQIQARYGNRYAEQVIMGLRGRENQGAEEATTEPTAEGVDTETGPSAASPEPAPPAPAVTTQALSTGPSETPAAGSAATTGGTERPPTIQRQALNWISAANDPAEREADATAKKVMRMPVSDDDSSDASVGPPRRRPEAATVDRKAVGDGDVSPRATSGISASLPSGKPLPDKVRGDMEPRFNADFSQVKVHTGEKPAELNRAVSARAFTVGQHLFFGQDEYRPESTSGRELIAHELTHTVQQGAAPHGDGIERSEGPTVTESSKPKVQRLGISDALDFFAERAYLIPGFRMLTIILGINPINMRGVDRSAANILRALIEFMPGGGLITMALDNYGVFERAGAWVEEQINALAMTGSAIRDSIMSFLDSLSWTDIFDLGGVWQRAKRIFTEPIDRLIALARGAVDAVIELIKEAILRPLAEQAQSWAGYDLLRALLGFDPISGDPVERTPEVLIGGFMRMIGQEEIWNNLQQANAVERAWAWFQGALAGLMAFVVNIPMLFIQALQALRINDIVELPTVIGRVVGIFTDAIGQFGAWALQQVLGLLQIIFEVVAPGVMPYIQRAAGAFRAILEDPIGFVGNLVRAGIQGLEQFARKFLIHLRTSLIGWLTGTMSGAGIYIPQAFNLEEIAKFVLSVLGLTWENIREKLVRRIGEPAVVALETGFDLVVTLVREGPAAAWEKIVEAVSNLREMVMEQIMTFVLERVVQAAITRLVTSLNPAGAFIQAIIATYNTIMFFVERLRQIAQVAMAFIDSIAAIAGGVISEAANRVEQTMAGMLTLVISFLARIAGLGRVSDAVVRIVNRIRALINNALERVVDWIMSMARRVGQLFGVGEEEEGEAEEDLNDPITAARNAVQTQLGGETTPQEAERVLTNIRDELQPAGLKTLELSPENEAGERTIVGEASPGRVLGTLSPEEASVSLSANITLEDDRPVTEELGENLEFGTERRAGEPEAEGPYARVRGASGQPETVRVLRPSLPRQLVVEAWNTTVTIGTTNVSHAEAQMVEWLINRPDPWLQRVASVVITLTHSPCDRCANDLERVRNIFDALGKPDVDLVVTWSAIYRETSETGIGTLSRARWRWNGPVPSRMQEAVERLQLRDTSV